MPIAELASASIYYETHGSGPSLVFAHGAGGNHRSWFQQVPHFETDFNCLVFDHPGFGKSRWSEGVSDDVIYGDFLIELLDHLSIERTIIVAQSMGGWTAMGVQARQPERLSALILASTSCGVTAPEIVAARVQREALLQGQRERWASNPAHVFNPALGERALYEEPELHARYAEITEGNPAGAASDRSRWGEFDPEIPESISVPTLLVNGEEDIIAPYSAIKSLADLIPESQLEVFNRSGHSVYFERAIRFNDLVATFLIDAGPS
ncbi:MAG: alpha/beta fold hydrolase [Chloroflexi bacterium]|nr:alpha/beta fold hydrolase [Chloroflexota bacterium]